MTNHNINNDTLYRRCKLEHGFAIEGAYSVDNFIKNKKNYSPYNH